MDAERYQSFLDHLTEVAAAEDEVIGLVVLGSGAAKSRRPDEWSDHDVWLVTKNGDAARWRTDTSWLPEAERIVGHFVETTHGRSVIYDDGHLLELAVFDDREVEIVRVNDYRVLYDASDIAERIAQRAAATAAETAIADPRYPAGRFVTQLIIGLGRFGRGERLSANQLIRGFAVGSLLHALAASDVGSDPDVLDNLDPHRRVEVAMPEIAARIDRSLQHPLAETAQTLVAIAHEYLATPDGPLSIEVVRALRAAIDRAATEAGPGSSA
ncbi:MAG: hypothetical protein QNJ88_11615 [Acidimicrobiia bacterium]|nr:hypothetical protein [Acidimicrobiia bacterium]